MSGLTERELLDLFDRTEAQPLIRSAIRQTLGGIPSPPALPDDRDSWTLLRDDEASVERLAAALEQIWMNPYWNDGPKRMAPLIIEALRG